MNINKIFYLSTCSTCKEILKSIKNLTDFELIDIKKQNISEQELDELYSKTKSYEFLFSKKSRNYSSVKTTIQNDEDFKKLILSDYTFLRRPVICYGNELFVGNDKLTKEKIKEVLGS
ncbi:MAG TPA: arsenate reductase family protein [Crocinitomicaceae bacterium]|nr:arsenate reductase family protein [Crocinitomicaceae bacterium]